MALTLKTNFGYPSNKAWGSLWYQGAGLYPPLGSGAYAIYYSSPVQIGGLTSWKDLHFSTTSMAGTGYAIETDNTLWTWGANEYGQLGLNVASSSIYYSPTQVGVLTDWKVLACRDSYAGAVKADGTLWTWGNNGSGALGIGVADTVGGGAYRISPVQVGALTNWLQLSGSSARIALKTDGTLWSWGYGANGRLGNGNIVSYSSPIQIGALTTWAQVSCATSVALAIKTDGTLWAWGAGVAGIGNNTTAQYSSPIQIGALTTWSKVFAGPNVNFAIKTDGTLWGWGTPVQGAYNNGLLGNGSTAAYSSPIQIGALTNWNTVVSSPYGVTAIKNDGSLWAWGYVSVYSSSYSSPVQIGSNTKWVTATPADSIGSTAFYGIIREANDPGATYVTKDYLLETYPNLAFTLGAKVTPGLVSWGDNASGQLAQGNIVSYSSPVQIGAGTNWKTLATGYYTVLALKQQDNTLWGWGSSLYGQLGNGSTASYSSPIQIGALTNWQQISTGIHTLAVKTDGTLWGWGHNLNGSIGNGASNNYSSPVQIGALTNWRQVTTSWSSTSLAIKTNGTLWAWGYGLYGQIGNGATASYSSPVQVGALTNWKQVSCRNNTAAAIKTDGTLWAWGRNNYGQLGNSNIVDYSSPVQIGALTNWAQVVSAGGPIAAIKTDGTLWTWGQNGDGQTGNNTTVLYSSPVQVGALTNWKRVYADNRTIYAVKNDGTLWSWGFNNAGAMGNSNSTSYSSPVQIGSLTTWKFVGAGISGAIGILDGYF